MDKSMLGLLGGASALALVSSGAALAAATSPATDASGLRPAQSFAELLDPIPNAVNTLRAQEEKGSEPLQLAQVTITTTNQHHHHQSSIVIPLPGTGNGS